MKKSVFLLLLCLLLLPQGSYAADAPAPYGANLFQGNFGQGGAAGAIAPGDRVVLRLWGGSLNVDTILEVSPAGQLDIPEVGQLNVTGLAQDKLQDALRSKLAASGHADSQTRSTEITPMAIISFAPTRTVARCSRASSSRASRAPVAYSNGSLPPTPSSSRLSGATSASTEVSTPSCLPRS